MKSLLVSLGVSAFIATTALSAQLNRAKPRPAPAAPAAAPVAAPPTVAEEKPPEVKPEKPQASAEFKMIGAIGMAYAENTYVLTCGGPKLGFTYGWFGLAIGFFPSLVLSNIYRNLNVDTPVRPNLGFGPEISFGKIAMIAPIFYMPGDRYYYTIGAGYKF